MAESTTSPGGPRAVFLSYASQDAEAARRLCESLRAAGVEVWFDADGGLEHGDEWDTKIRRQIKECVLFVPLISANTQARHEGYFRIEWDLAAERARGIASGVPFILPVLVDDTHEPDALVPDRFRSVQWIKAPGGETSPETRAQFAKLWAQRTGSPKPAAARTAPEKLSTNQASQAARSPKYLYLVAALVLASAVAGWWWLGGRESSTGERAAVPGAGRPLPPAAVPVAATDFPLDPVLRRVYAILYNVVDGIAEDFALMDDLVKPLLDARPNDPEVVTVAAELAQEFVTRGFDQSQARRAQAQRLTERAVKLAPDNPEALAALGYYLLSTNSQLGRAEELLRRAIKLKPAEPRFRCFLYSVIIARKAPRNEIDAFETSLASDFPDYPMVPYLIGAHHLVLGDLTAAEEWVDKSLALAPLPTAVVMKARIMLEVHGDVAGMEQCLERMPERQRTSARFLYLYGVLATVTGQTGSARRALDATADTWLTESTYIFPKAQFEGELEQIDGHEGIARRQFEAALVEIKRKLAADPTDLRPVRAELGVQIALGRHDEALTALRINLEKRPRPYRWNMGMRWWNSSLRACLLLGERAEAISQLREACVESQGRLLLRNLFRVDPKMAAFRDDPEIAALLAEPTASAVASPPPDEHSVAVLAFANLSDDKANEYFSDGISEELLNVLAKIPELKVAARTSAFYFKGRQVQIGEIARQLGVAYIVEGSVRTQGERVRITAQLIKATNGFHVWSDTFTRELKDIFAVQDELARTIAGKISPMLGQVTLPASRGAIDPAAFQEYLAGRAEAAKAGPSELRRAAAHFEQAGRLAPTYTAAWVQLAGAYVQLARWGGMPAIEGWTAAKQAIGRAAALEPDSPDVLLVRGWIQRTSEWDWKGAERSFRRSLELRPNHPETLSAAAVLLFNIGQREEALQLGRRAVALDPLNAATYLDLALIFFFAEDWTALEQTAHRALELAPASVSAHMLVAVALARQGRDREAEVELAHEIDEVARVSGAGVLAAYRGDRPQALRQIGLLEERSARLGDTADLQLGIAQISTQLGDRDRAFRALEKVRSEHDPAVAWLRNEFLIRPLHADPRWETLLRSVGLADDQLK